MKPLLGKNDPALFDVINPRAGAPLIVCCDHAGRCIPESFGNLGLARECLDLHIACDIGARQVAMMLTRKFGAPLLLANYSRLVIDLNRHLDDPTLIPETSDGVVIPGNAGLSHEQRHRRIDQMFAPYHRYYGGMVDRLRAKFIKPIILAVHSFTPQIQGLRRPWDIGLLWEHHHDLARALADNLRKNDGLCIGLNQPYHALDPLGYAMVVHAQARGVEMALIEIRQDRITDPRGQQWAANLLHRAVAPLLDYSEISKSSDNRPMKQRRDVRSG